MKVLIIENDPGIIETVSLVFERRWPHSEFLSASTGAKGLEMVEREAPDLVILDLGLPDVDGTEVLRDIRRFSEVPVIILSVRNDTSTIVQTLGGGADDYVTKPFDSMVLLARAKKAMERHRPPEGEIVIQEAGMVIDLTRQRVTLRGQPISLTSTEWAILKELVGSPGRMVTHRMLAEKLWGEEGSEIPSTIRSYIARLRKKLGDDPDNPVLIRTEYGIGYRFMARQ